ncbi:MAG: hypothetical protein AAB309_04820 [Deltaproteobacteria bacterium]
MMRMQGKACHPEGEARRIPPLIFLFLIFLFFTACTKKSKTVEVENFSVIYTTTVLGEIEPCG